MMMDAANDINDLRNPPANHLEKLEGDRKDNTVLRLIINIEFVL